mmetsp:Transcript_6631/g.5665  ORF Transcript_6631/g.5665 Transcript_6631/m.5665 type:complete len:145 (+) Transcript_6631:3-437(+)
MRLVQGQVRQTHRIVWHEDTEILADIEIDWPSEVIRKVKVGPSRSVPEETLESLIHVPGTLMLLQRLGSSYRLIQWMSRPRRDSDDARSDAGSTGGRAFDPLLFPRSIEPAGHDLARVPEQTAVPSFPVWSMKMHSFLSCGPYA